MVIAVILLIVVIGGAKFLQIKAMIAGAAKYAQPPAAVTTTVAKTQTWQPVLNSVGALKAVNGVVVTTELPGTVAQISFESGAWVKKGDLLLKIDTRQEDAILEQALAKLELSKVTLARQKDLLAKKAIAQSDYDSAAADMLQNNALVENAKAVIARKTITAPFDGVLGIRQVNLGQYLNAGTGIVPLQSLDPIYVDFSIPQQDINKIAVGKKIRFTVNGIEGKEYEGEISSLDSLVDPATRNIAVEATVHNEDGKMRPGMFVKVEVLLPPQEGVVAIPSSAINYAPYGNSVFIVKPKKDDKGQPVKTADGKDALVVEETFVTTGPTRGDMVSIVTGLKDGDEVVTSGVFKLHGGADVLINNTVQPGNEENPKPPDS